MKRYLQTFLLFSFLACALIITKSTKDYQENLRIYGSWDIRGDPVMNPRYIVSPWNMGTSVPYYNRRLDMI